MNNKRKFGEIEPISDSGESEEAEGPMDMEEAQDENLHPELKSIPKEINHLEKEDGKERKRNLEEAHKQLISIYLNNREDCTLEPDKNLNKIRKLSEEDTQSFKNVMKEVLRTTASFAPGVNKEEFIEAIVTDSNLIALLNDTYSDFVNTYCGPKLESLFNIGLHYLSNLSGRSPDSNKKQKLEDVPKDVPKNG